MGKNIEAYAFLWSISSSTALRHSLEITSLLQFFSAISLFERIIFGEWGTGGVRSWEGNVEKTTWRIILE